MIEMATDEPEIATAKTEKSGKITISREDAVRLREKYLAARRSALALAQDLQSASQLLGLIIEAE
jgi:hypothetical protein